MAFVSVDTRSVVTAATPGAQVAAAAVVETVIKATSLLDDVVVPSAEANFMFTVATST